MKTKSQEIKQGDYVLITDRSSKFKTKYGVVKKVQSKGYVVTVEDNGKSFDAKVTKKGVLFSEKGGSDNDEYSKNVELANEEAKKIMAGKGKYAKLNMQERDELATSIQRKANYKDYNNRQEKHDLNFTFADNAYARPFFKDKDWKMIIIQLNSVEKLNEEEIKMLLESKFIRKEVHPYTYSGFRKWFSKNGASALKELKEELVGNNGLEKIESEITSIENQITALEQKRDELQEQKTKIIAQEILDGKRNAAGKPFMPWQKELTEDEIEFIISAINRYGSGDHPKASKQNWLSFKFDYIKGVLQKIDVKEHLGAEGAVVFKSVLTKFNL